VGSSIHRLSHGLPEVNYYIKHLLVDEEGNFNKTLDWIAHARDPKIVWHPLMVILCDLVWSSVASRRFLYGKSWFLSTLVLFIISQSVMKYVHSVDEKADKLLERSIVFGIRVFIYGFSMTQLQYVQLTKLWKSIRAKEYIRYMGMRIPKHWENWMDFASVNLMTMLLIMLCLEPIIHCWNHNGGKLFYAECQEAKSIELSYSIFSMLAMFLYYGLLIDFFVFSMRVSAFVLV
jgi:hypothetical protein